jgi:hypothetical protein
MLILTTYRGILQANAQIAAKARGGVHINIVEQNVLRPNILLSLVGDGQDYTHQGAVALMDAGVRIECRADTSQAVGELGKMVRDFLQDWTGTFNGCWVQLTQHDNSSSAWDEKLKLHTYAHEFTSFYREVT